MNRDKIGTQTCYVHERTFVGTLTNISGQLLPESCSWDMCMLVAKLFFIKGVKSFPLNVEGCRDGSTEK